MSATHHVDVVVCSVTQQSTYKNRSRRCRLAHRDDHLLSYNRCQSQTMRCSPCMNLKVVVRRTKEISENMQRSVQWVIVVVRFPVSSHTQHCMSAGPMFTHSGGTVPMYTGPCCLCACPTPFHLLCSACLGDRFRLRIRNAFPWGGQVTVESTHQQRACLLNRDFVCAVGLVSVYVNPSHTQTICASQCVEIRIEM